MVVRTKEEFISIRRCGKDLASALNAVVAMVRPGITLRELDEKAREEMEKRGARPSFLGYGTPPFPGALCTSPNEVVVHGIPDERVLSEGDCVGLDIGLERDGFYVDMATTVAVGEVKKQIKSLMKVTEESLHHGISAAMPGKKVGVIGYAIQTYIKKSGNYGIVRDFAGHGVGRAVHEEPTVPNYGSPHFGPLIREGEILAIEPMITLGTERVRLGRNQWDVVTADGSPSAHYEHTVLYHSKLRGPYIITTSEDFPEDDGSWW